ncbi:TPA: secretion system protein [Candidatus Saccharibacteria bacterium]|nr:secretion system protein [Candidatus Saccharibacteria bacterium]HRK40758.1 type II secretion system F family protein [Candidatus Saccharibacteria bacterium]
MPIFSYQATNQRGKTINGTLNATDKETALSLMKRQGLKPISIEAQSAVKKGALGFMKPKVKITDLVLFTRQLSTMVSAGVPLLRALTTMRDQVENPTLHAIIGDLIKDIQNGVSLADAMQKHPDVFNDIFVNMVRAGEAAGIVDDILKRLATQVEKNASMRKKIKSASTYPIVLLALTVGAFLGLMIFIIPRIAAILKDLGGPDAELPLITQVMINISSFMTTYWYIVVGGTALAIFLLRRYVKTPAGRYQLHSLVLKVPILNNLIVKISVARFTRTFAALIGAGVSVVEALKVTSRAIGNDVYQKAIEAAAEDVVNGKQLSQSLEGNKLFPGIVPQMLAVGEETGQTDEVLVKVADFYDEEVDAIIDGLSSILEPVMIVIMGGMVGLVAASVMGPIASLSQNVGS